MIIFPAIDIRDGRCVRLIEGDFSRETVFDADPADAARRWAGAGAAWTHVVDLDGSVAGEPINLAAIARIRAAVSLRLQLGGGIRSMAHIESALNSGIDRIVLGTSVVHDRSLVEEAARRWPDRIAVGLDARGGLLATRGWLDQSEINAIDAARELRAAGVREIIFTDIGRDGTLRGPNLAVLAELQQVLGDGLIASGGVSSIGDIRALAKTGVEGVIIGRALYDGRINLPDAIVAAQFDDSTVEARA